MFALVSYNKECRCQRFHTMQVILSRIAIVSMYLFHPPQHPSCLFPPPARVKKKQYQGNIPFVSWCSQSVGVVFGCWLYGCCEYNIYTHSFGGFWKFIFLCAKKYDSDNKCQLSVFGDRIGMDRFYPWLSFLLMLELDALARHHISVSTTFVGLLNFFLILHNCQSCASSGISVVHRPLSLSLSLSSFSNVIHQSFFAGRRVVCTCFTFTVNWLLLHSRSAKTLSNSHYNQVVGMVPWTCRRKRPRLIFDRSLSLARSIDLQYPLSHYLIVPTQYCPSAPGTANGK